MSDPEYPKVAVSRGLTDVVPLRVLLCTSGRVLAAYPLTSYDNNDQPIEHERVLTEAAMSIASSRTFVPLLHDGMPVAGWIHVQVAFRP
jgi:adenosine/AMP kinase